MPVTYVIEFDVRPERREQFLRLLSEVLFAMAGEKSYRSAALHVSPDDPFRFMLVETWADHQEVVEIQLHRPYRAEWHEALPDLLKCPRRISVWAPLEIASAQE